MPEPFSISARVREIISAAGIDNFRMEHGVLTLCGKRYVVERCGCGEPGCNGVRLRKESEGGPQSYIALQ